MPAVIRGADFGQCLREWSPNYLRNKLNDSLVSVHVSSEPKLDFIKKNFSYKTMAFNEFIDKCVDKSDEYLYLRSLGSDRRARLIANIKTDFPSIGEDIKIPKFLSINENIIDCNENNENQLFSSVFRISSKDLVLWTHYDIMDNILLQVKGSKRVALFPPESVPFLYLIGDKSQVVDIDAPNEQLANNYPLFLKATRYECILEEGDALFIPSLWFHNVKALDFSIGINFFWKDKQISDNNFYNKSDVYGNKDLVPASDAFVNLDKAIKHTEKLPKKFRDFYLRIMINKLQNKLI
jgi:tRNA wybutosine-synthesizing protein 5